MNMIELYLQDSPEPLPERATALFNTHSSAMTSGLAARALRLKEPQGVHSRSQCSAGVFSHV